MGALVSILGTSASWATLDIKVVVQNGVANGSLNSKAYDSATVLASTGWAGAWTATITGGDVGGNYDINDTWLAFCTDLGNTMSSTLTYKYDPKPFSAGDPNAANPPDPKWAQANAGLFASKIYDAHVAEIDTPIERSAMAIAIWEVLYENSPANGEPYDVLTKGSGRGFVVTTSTGSTTLGDFSADAQSAIKKANDWLDAIGGQTGPPKTWFAEADTRNPQSILGPENPVPEPGTYIAGALLLLPFFASTIRAVRRPRS